MLAPSTDYRELNIQSPFTSSALTSVNIEMLTTYQRDKVAPINF